MKNPGLEVAAGGLPWAGLGRDNAQICLAGGAQAMTQTGSIQRAGDRTLILRCYRRW